jgi:hypothetical protein
MKQFIFIMLAVICVGCASQPSAGKLPTIAPGKEYGGVKVDNTPTIFEGKWYNDNQDGSVYVFHGNTYLTTDEIEENGNGGTFRFTDDKIIIYITFYLIDNEKVEPLALQEIELNYLFKGTELVMWNNLNEDQKWVYKKE